MSFFHGLLLWLPPETAHGVAKIFLRLLQWWRFDVLKRKLPVREGVSLLTTGSVRFRTRVGIAAGLDKNAEFFAGLGALGAGFVEIGTVTPLPQAGNPRPRVWRPAPGTLINHMGFNSDGLEAVRSRLRNYRPKTQGLPVFANIGKNRNTPNESAIEDYRKGFEGLQGLVDGFVVNLSSPNTPGLTSLQSEEFLQQIAAAAPKSVPVWVKLSPDLDNRALAKLAEFVEHEKNLNGLVVTNTSREMAEEVFGWEQGGLSGRPLFSRALECVSIVRQAAPHKTLVGVGGVWNRDSARQMRRAGADLVEVYTGFVYRGSALLRELLDLE